MRSRWIVVLVAFTGIVSAVACQAPTPTSSPDQATVITSPDPTPQLECGPNVTLTDPLGLAEGCSSRVDYSSNGNDRVTILSAMLLEARWIGATCAPVNAVTLDRDFGGEVLTITSRGPQPPLAPNASCAGGPLPIDLDITLASPISPNLRASLNGEELQVVTAAPAGVSPAPAPPTTGVMPSSQQFSCGRETTLTDSTGLVATCDATQSVDIKDRGLFLTDTTVQATFFIYGCTNGVQATMTEADGNYLLDIVNLPYPWHSAEPTCAGGIGLGNLIVGLRSPLTGPLTATVEGQGTLGTANPSPSIAPTPTSHTIDISNWHVTCEIADSKDCTGIAKLFANNLAWSYLEVFGQTHGLLTVTSLPSCPSFPDWVIGTDCWQASGPTKTTFDGSYESDGQACMIVARNDSQDGFGQIGGDYFMDSTVVPGWDQCT